MIAFQSISERLPEADAELRLAHVAALSVFAYMAPDAFEQRSDTIISFLLTKVLMTPAPHDPVGPFETLRVRIHNLI